MTNIWEPNEKNIYQASERIKSGGVVVCPTDCNLGLAVDPNNSLAIKKVFEIKDRPANKPLTLFINNKEEWKNYCNYTEEQEQMVQKLAQQFWPGPLNIVLEKKNTVNTEVVCGNETVAVSYMKNDTLNKLIKYFGSPIAMTSANISGTADDTLVDVEMASRQIGHKVDAILDGGAQNTTKSSTIVDITNGFRLLREGDITLKDIEASLEF